MHLDAVGGRPLHPAAAAVLEAAHARGYADPRGLHRAAREAGLLLENAREVVAEALGCRRDEVRFAPSGPDAAHRGLLGLLAARPEASVVGVGAVEHSAVLQAADWAARGGLPGRTPARVEVLPVDGVGRVDPDAVRALVAGPERPALVAVQSANLEIGSRQPVAEVVEALGGPPRPGGAGVPLLLDATASLGHEALPAGWSVATAAGGSVGGPAGTALLLVRRGVRWEHPLPGDPEHLPHDVPGALALAAALQASAAEAAEAGPRLRRLVDRVRTVAATLPDADVVGDPEDRVPHVVTFSCLYLQGEALVRALDARGFGVASGSACTASTLEPSHVLAAIGAVTHGNVRVSLTPATAEADVERFLAALVEVVGDLRAEVGL